MTAFNNKGWLYYTLMHQIGPDGGAWGTGVHWGTQAVMTQPWMYSHLSLPTCHLTTSFPSHWESHWEIPVNKL